jgi:hypothetical protein
VRLPSLAELVGKLLELRRDVLLRDDLVAEAALVEAAGNLLHPRDVMLAVEHGV